MDIKLEGWEIKMDESKPIRRLILKNKKSGTEYIFHEGCNGWIYIVAKDYNAAFYDVGKVLEIKGKHGELLKVFGWSKCV